MKCHRPNAAALMAYAMPGTTAELTVRTGLHHGTVERHITAMRAFEACHIGGWARMVGYPGQHWIAIYHRGPGDDVPCRFKKLARAVVNSNYQKRIREDGRIDLVAAKKRSRYWTTKAETMGDPLINALFGRTNMTTGRRGQKGVQ